MPMLELDFSALADRANSDGEFPRAARYWNGRVAFVIDDRPTVLRAVDGRVEVADPEPELGEHDISFAAASADWAKLLAPTPPAC